MCAKTVYYTRQNYGTTTEKLAFECDKSFSGTTTNLHQQNPCMTSENKLVTIPYCTIYYLRYQEFLTACVLSAKYYWISYSIDYSLV